MGREWTRKSVSELQSNGVLLVEDGNHGEYRPRTKEFTSDGVPFIRAADLGHGRILFGAAERINDTALRRIRKGIGAPGDVLLSHKGTVGKVALAPSECEPFVCSPQTTFWRVLDNNVLDPRFLYYFLQSPEFRRQLDSRKGETDMADYVSLTTQRTLQVVFPKIDEQRAIVGVLGALDDKIVLNQQTNSTLESILRAVFKSWFVDFDPVREKAGGRDPNKMSAEIASLFPNRLKDRIPVGWRMGTLGEVAENLRRQVKPVDIAGDTPYVGLEHMPRKHIALTEWGSAGEVASNKFGFRVGDVLFGKLRPYFHKVGVAAVDGVCSTDVLVVTGRQPEWFSFVLGHLSSDDLIAYTDAGSTGTKMPRTSWSELSSYEVVLPSVEVAKQFDAIARLMVERIRNNIHESHTLAALRDALLPKVLSGDMRVQSAEPAAIAARRDQS